ncbi:Hypothetical Protein FCC1311_011462 [Hondaea fermentalgiana]|uniref:Transmembrane protein n=1 Tax=Hondaea fermentalgiana TaxID=2315210 RepID=A0A2R5G3M9_9STRA|nr:Hypothetical Protein FCC1311_011462 [Hondaea fermentalgiana]|eukprot:GBG24929.1 Hypothetical Protein FCC1311_011462 [Hondaea fermentalgiana]
MYVHNDSVAPTVVTADFDDTPEARYVEQEKFMDAYRRQSTLLKFTPSGGSQCQQSSKLIMWILFVCTCAVVALVTRGFSEIMAAYDEEILATEPFVAWKDTSRNSVSDLALNATYTALIANGTDSTTLCDVPFFLDGESNDLLIETLDYADYLCSVFFIAGAIAASIYLCTKCCVTVGLTKKPYQNEGNKGDAPVLHEVKVGGFLETKAERRVRIFLRGETLGYMLAQGVQDVPLFTFALTYYFLRTSTRGSKCAICVADGELCSPDTVDELDFSVKLAMGAVVVSLFWNAILLAERWIEFVKFKKQKRHGYYNPRKYFLIALVFFIVYVITILSPMAMTIHYYLGPFMPALPSTQLIHILGVVGLCFWGAAVIFINLVAGIDPGEILSCPVLCCEISEFVCESSSCVCCSVCC